MGGNMGGGMNNQVAGTPQPSMAPTPNPMPSMNMGSMSGGAMAPKKKSKKGLLWVLLLIIVALGAWYFMKGDSKTTDESANMPVENTAVDQSKVKASAQTELNSIDTEYSDTGYDSLDQGL